MARESSDPDQVSYFSDGEEAPLPPPADIIIGGPKQTPTVPTSPRLLTQAERQAERNADRDRRAGELAAPIAPPPPPREGERVPVSREDPSAELRRQLDQQRDATRRAENAARDAMNRAAQAETQIGRANVHMVTSAIEAAQRASDQAQMQMHAFLDSGDHRGAAAAQVAVADARANLLRLQEQKAIIEEVAKRPPPPQPAVGPQAFDANAARNNIINELNRTGFPRSAQWINAHPEMINSRERIDEVDGAHRFATHNLKLRPESDDYFNKMEELLGMQGQRLEPTRSNYVEPRNQRDQYRQAPAASAPANSGAPSYRTGETRQQEVHLTALMREHAHNVLGMTDEEYAAELIRAHEENKLLVTRL